MAWNPFRRKEKWKSDLDKPHRETVNRRIFEKRMRTENKEFKKEIHKGTSFGGYGKIASATASGANKYGGRAITNLANFRKRQLTFNRKLRHSIVGPEYPGYKGKGGGRGRPQGSYDSRYAQYGGVWGYRKFMRAKIRQQNFALEQQRMNNQLSPAQQNLLREDVMRRNAVLNDPEKQIIPDTRGTVRMKSFQDEINDAANLVP